MISENTNTHKRRCTIIYEPYLTEYLMCTYSPGTWRTTFLPFYSYWTLESLTLIKRKPYKGTHFE